MISQLSATDIREAARVAVRLQEVQAEWDLLFSGGSPPTIEQWCKDIDADGLSARHVRDSVSGLHSLLSMFLGGLARMNDMARYPTMDFDPCHEGTPLGGEKPADPHSCNTCLLYRPEETERTCDTCKHWKMQDCEHPKLTEASSVTCDDYASAWDCDGSIPIETGPKFGCVQHQKREEP